MSNEEERKEEFLKMLTVYDLFNCFDLIKCIASGKKEFRTESGLIICIKDKLEMRIKGLKIEEINRKETGKKRKEYIG